MTRKGSEVRVLYGPLVVSFKTNLTVNTKVRTSRQDTAFEYGSEYFAKDTVYVALHCLVRPFEPTLAF